MNHSHDHSHSVPTPSATASDAELSRYKDIRHITLIGAVVNVFLSIGKIACGYIGQSQALIADGLHSLSDLASDIIVLFAAKHGGKAADEDHPYGHARIETFFTVILGLFLLIVACGIIVDALIRIIEPQLLLHPSAIALVAALISIVAKEVLYQYTAKVADKLDSNLLRANAWHHRSDAISSIIVVIGIGGTMLGVQYLDAIAAIGLGLMIIKIGWVLCLSSVQELVDKGLSEDRLAFISQQIQLVPGVLHMHNLRTRKMGSDALVDVHIQVAPKISVSEGHFISDSVHNMLVDTVPEVVDVMVHIDPEDNEEDLSSKLPSRQKFRAELMKFWTAIPEAQYIDKINLHYLDGQIHIEVLLPLAKFDSKEEAENTALALKAAVENHKKISEVEIFFH